MFAGQDDNVRCFFCDGGLRNWEREDDPFTEHARWFPRCSFIREVRGNAFVDALATRYPRTQNMVSTRQTNIHLQLVQIKRIKQQLSLTDCDFIEQERKSLLICANMKSDVQVLQTKREEENEECCVLRNFS